MPDGEPRASSDEAAPLLPGRPRPSHRRLTSLASIPSVHIPHAHNKNTIIGLLFLVISLATCGSGFLQLPEAQLIEDVICDEYYRKMGPPPDTPTDEDPCKVEAVSAELAFVLAIISTMIACVGLLVTFPWSALADKCVCSALLSTDEPPLTSVLGLGGNLSCLWPLQVSGEVLGGRIWR